MQSATTDRENDFRPWVAGWLWLVALMVVGTVIVGGATRLTNSGLSITEWQPLMGAIPPLNDAAWRDAFVKYQAIPEYELVNKGISLSDFKIIFWWEWSHRLLARAAGVVFLLPFVVFWLSGQLPRRLIPALALVFVLGALQGALGWYMVKSGLTSRVDVSPYRLAAHLSLAAILLALIVWIALGLASPARRLRGGPPFRALLLVTLILLQIVIGGFMSGIDAGLVTASWPDMDGKFIPDGLFALSPWWRNLFENALTVQFNHRLVAYLVGGFAAMHVYLVCGSGAPAGVSGSGLALLAIVLLQLGLGIATLTSAVPFDLALLHQAGALLVLVAAVFHLHVLIRHDKSRSADARLLPNEKFR